MVISDKGAENLVEAIVRQAAKDYRAVRYSKDEDDLYEKKKLEKFFLSGWFHLLTGLDGELVLKRLQEGD